MKALLVAGGKNYSIVETSAPAPGDDEVLVKVHYAAICASDFEVLYGLNEEEVVYPIIPGHEWAGEVVKAGKNFEFLIGKRVTGDNAIPCMKCPPCERGKYHICKNKKELGFSLNGAFAEYLRVPGYNIIELPLGIDTKTASLVEPLSVSLHAIRLAGMDKNQKTLIIGDGPIGLAIIILASHLDIKNLMIAGHHQERLDMTRSWTGAQTVNTHNLDLDRAFHEKYGQKADIIFDTTGRANVISEAFEMLEHGGTLCLVGCYLQNVEFSPNTIMLREQSILGSVSYYRSEMQEVLQLLEDGLLEGKKILTHEFKLDDYIRAFEVVEKRKDNVIKGCFKM